MTNSLYEQQKMDLIAKIRSYDQLIAGYEPGDLPKTENELESMTLDDLQDWLKVRMTSYQFQIDADISDSNPSCESSGSENSCCG